MVVLVVGATVDVVADAGVVVGAPVTGTVVVEMVSGVVVVVVDPAWEMACNIVVMVVADGFGMLAPDGTNATVIN